MVQFLLAPTRISTSSHQSRRHVKLPCRTRGGLIFAGRSNGAEEEIVQLQLEKKLADLEKKLVEHQQISRASPFCYVIDILC